MQKIILGMLVIAFLTATIGLTSNVAFAANDPFAQLQLAISNLQSQINNLQSDLTKIQLTPGPQGPPGPKGDTGVTGPQGPAGPGANEQVAPIVKFLKVTGQKQGNIVGGVTQKGKEGTIGVIAVNHSIISPRDPASGLPTGKRQHHPLVVDVHIDKATPLLYNALVSNENLPTVELDFWKTNMDGSESMYFTIKLTNANIASIDQVKQNSVEHPDLLKFAEYEEIAFTYQKIEWTWVDGGITAMDDWEAPVA